MSELLKWLEDYWWIPLILGWGVKCFLVDVIRAFRNRDTATEIEVSDD